MRRVRESNYKTDKYYPKVLRAVEALLECAEAVSPVDLLLQMQRITKKQYEDWRFGRIPYLEKVATGNLEKLARILRLFEFVCCDRGMTPSSTEYRRWGKRGRKMPLRFTKFGDAGVEAAYRRHFVLRARNEKAATGDPDPRTKTRIEHC